MTSVVSTVHNYAQLRRYSVMEKAGYVRWSQGVTTCNMMIMCVNLVSVDICFDGKINRPKSFNQKRIDKSDGFSTGDGAPSGSARHVGDSAIINC